MKGRVSHVAMMYVRSTKYVVDEFAFRSIYVHATCSLTSPPPMALLLLFDGGSAYRRSAKALQPAKGAASESGKMARLEGKRCASS